MRRLGPELLPHRGAGAVRGRLTDRIAEGGLLPAERALVADAVPARRAQFATARRCARAALADLGHSAVPILHDESRRPRWPAGVVGSLTHCEGLAVAVAAPSAVCLGVGVDAEPAVPLPEDVAEMLLTRAERRRLVAWHRADAPGGTVVFSVKESAFKVFNPLTNGWLDPDDVDVVVGADGAATADLARPLPDGTTRLTGRWALVARTIVTLLAVPAAETVSPGGISPTPLVRSSWE